MYTGLNMKEFYVLPTQYIYVSCVDLRKKKQLLIPYRTLIGFNTRDRVFTARYELNL
jgi:hypothetical protein